MTDAAPDKEPEKTNLNRGGRPKGSPNKFTASAKQAFQSAFDDLGGVDALVKWAKQDDEHMGDFYKLYARLIPVDLKVETPQLDKVVDAMESAREILFALQLASRQAEPAQPVQH